MTVLRGRSTEPNLALEKFAREITDLRPLPAVVARVFQVQHGGRFAAQELAQAISSDRALTVKILQLANSACYSFPRRISTVRDAVVLLGFRTVRSTAIVCSVLDTAAGKHNLDYQQFARFSVTVGMLTDVLARATGTHLDEAFTAGVLHNIGRLALDQHRPKAISEIRRYAEANLVSIPEAQRAVLGFTDAELGGALALNWSFPEELVGAISCHQLDVDDVSDRNGVASFVIRSRTFARSHGLSDGIDSPSERPPAPEWTAPPTSTALRQAGGMDGVLDWVDVFLGSTL